MKSSWVRRVGAPLSALAFVLGSRALLADPLQELPVDPPAAPSEGQAPTPSPDAPPPPLEPAPVPVPDEPSPPLLPSESPPSGAYPSVPAGPPDGGPALPPPAAPLPLPATDTPAPRTLPPPQDSAKPLPSQWALDGEGYDANRYDPSGSAHAQDDAPRKKDSSDGLFGPFRIGLLVGGGLPNLINFGATLKLTRFFGAGVNVGLIPTVKLSLYGKAEVSYQEYDAYARIFPFGGGFFFGSGIGYERAKGKFSTSQDSGVPVDLPGIPENFTTEARGSVRALIITPQIGYFQIFGPGFCVGVDVGAQIPIAPGEIKLSTKTPEIDQLPPAAREEVRRYFSPDTEEVHDTLKTIARTPIPSFSIKIGWVL